MISAAQTRILYRRDACPALMNFAKDRASYHVTTNLGKVPALDRLTDSELPGLMEQIDSRQLLHITYGSLLSAGTRLRTTLSGTRSTDPFEYEEDYYQRTWTATSVIIWRPSGCPRAAESGGERQTDNRQSGR